MLGVLGVLNVLYVLYVLNVLNVLNMLGVLYVLNMPMDASLACWALFLSVPHILLRAYQLAPRVSQQAAKTSQPVLRAFWLDPMPFSLAFIGHRGLHTM